MGYHETVCQLCGVSFAIARIRNADEPYEASWAYFGGEHVGGDDGTGEESDDEGCSTMTDSEEHIAGKSCRSTRGYNGNNISVLAMKGCRSVQCLVKKEAGWLPEDDDQTFERDTDYFLTGLGDGSPDEGPLEDIEPARHGVSELLIYNILVVDDDWGLPFHPTCFEIFKRVSIRHLGRVDVEGLWFWREIESTHEEFYQLFPRDPAVHRAKEQWWYHEAGFEYLAANPIQIPGLDSQVQTAFSTSTPFSHKVLGGRQAQDDSPNPTNPIKTRGAREDPFNKLPNEIVGAILSQLESKDIASMRLASAAFGPLPDVLFRKLLEDDMPWFWEVRHTSYENVQWHKVYMKATTLGKQSKGLMNRRRIWKDVSEVVRRIQMYRDQGKVGQKLP